MRTPLNVLAGRRYGSHNTTTMLRSASDVPQSELCRSGSFFRPVWTTMHFEKNMKRFRIPRPLYIFFEPHGFLAFQRVLLRGFALMVSVLSRLPQNQVATLYYATCKMQFLMTYQKQHIFTHLHDKGWQLTPRQAI